ncbi:hypothetical protein CMUST_10610 [Corynebacterium mustelae]|uniref:Uncharacterized protein n=1 Tax=Corynebacterium mustelae TaxID=571915 RepID=A0A0G3H3N0_9CORY|nr:hypothetical protein [Corynebacterium mustelae]AKK06438.1 hypothetical protein CMUST_10610 [Corynebacterium mustelae]
MMTQHPTSPHSVPLIAVAFRTPTHGAKPLVKLLPEPLVPAETAALQTIGLIPATHTPVGHTHNRALGFPAHLILTDPDNAHHALKLVKDLQWARRQAKTHPEDVEEFTDNLITQLSATTPQFLPTFLEEIARIYVTTHELNRAEKYFEQAREIERTYALPIDCERHTHAFTEFAKLGVIADETFAREARTIVAQFDPASAYDYFFTLLIAYSRARKNLYPKALRDLEKLAKQLGYSKRQVRTQFAAAFIPTRAFCESSEKLLDKIIKVVPEAAKVNPEIRSHLMRSIPKHCTPKQYFALLKRSGTWDDMCNEPEKLRAWFQYITISSQVGSIFGMPEKSCIDMLLAQKDTLSGVKITSKHSIPGALSDFHVDYLDLFLEIGILFDEKFKVEDINLFDWISRHYRDLKFLGQSSDFRPAILRACERIRDFSSFMENEHTRHIVFLWLEDLRQQYKNAIGSYEGLTKFQSGLPDLGDPHLKEIHPTAVAELKTHEPAKALQEAIRRGTKVEYAWPEFENLIETIRPDEGISIYSAFPYIAVSQGSTMYLLKGESQRIVEIPKASRIAFAVVTEDDVFLIYRDATNKHYFSFWESEGFGRPIRHEYDNLGQGDYTYIVNNIPYCGSTPIVKGKTLLEFPYHANIGFAPCYSKDRNNLVTNLSSGETMPLSEFTDKLRTGSTPGLNVPRFFLDQLPDNATFNFYNSYEVAADASTISSPLGTDSGRHFTYIFTKSDYNDTCYCVSPLGSYVFELDYDPLHQFNLAFMKKPSAESEDSDRRVWLIQGGKLHDLPSRLPINPSLTGTGEKHCIEKLPTAAFHYLSIRNESISENMRNCSLQQAATMIANPEKILEFTEGDKTIAAAIAGMMAEIGQINGFEIVPPPLPVVPDFLQHLYQVLTISELDQAIRREIASIHSPPLIEFWTESDFPISWSTKLQYSSETMKLLAAILRHPQKSGEFQIDTEDRFYALPSIGCEKLLLTWLALPRVPLTIVRKYYDLLRWCAEVGLLGTWRRITVRRTVTYNNNRIWWENNTLAMDTSFTEVRFWNPQIQARPAISSIDPFDDDYFLPKDEFLAALDGILAWHESRHANGISSYMGWEGKTVEEAAKEAAQVSTFPPCLWRLLIAGNPLKPYRFERDKKHKKYGMNPREDLGISLKRAYSFQVYIYNAIGHRSENLLALSWHKDFLRTGPSIAGIEKFWEHMRGKPWIHLTDDMFKELRPALKRLKHKQKVAFHGTSRRKKLATKRGSYRLFNVYVQLAHLVQPGTETARTLAKRFKDFASFDLADERIPLGSGYPADDSWDDSAKIQSPYLLQEGALDALINYLKTGTPFSGAPQDPLVSAPHTVSNAAQTLGITNEGARYFLQLLALANPTDKNIQKWNSWSTHQLDQARDELLAKNLVITAERDHTGRNVFLPGGWLHKSDTGPGIETWKTPHYPLWKAPVSRPIIPSCPPLVPYPELFQTVWQRYSLGDTPGYEELTTKPHRT